MLFNLLILTIKYDIAKRGNDNNVKSQIAENENYLLCFSRYLLMFAPLNEQEEVFFCFFFFFLLVCVLLSTDIV